MPRRAPSAVRRRRRAATATVSALVLLAWVVWATLFRLPPVDLRYTLTVEDLRPGTCGDCAFVTRLSRDSVRVFTPLATLPPAVPVAVVWLEDSRFWVHGGVDWQRLRAATSNDLSAGRYRVGASTITMQLARTLFLSRERARHTHRRGAETGEGQARSHAQAEDRVLRRFERMRQPRNHGQRRRDQGGRKQRTDDRERLPFRRRSHRASAPRAPRVGPGFAGSWPAARPAVA